MTTRTICAATALLLAPMAAADTIGVPGDFPTIQAAIEAALDGDEIVVAPGVYNEAIDLLGKAIVLRSEAGPDLTTIDGAGLQVSVVRCVSGEGSNTLIRGFTIANGRFGTLISVSNNWWVGGGLYVNQSSPTIEDCVFIGNRAGFGGGAYFRDSASIVRDCVFHGNTANTDGGGAQFFGGAVSVEDCVFSLNNAAQGHGGGSHVVLGEHLFTGCTFSNNIASVGGGFSFFTNGSPLSMIGATIVSNIATGSGGGFWVRSGFDQLMLQGSEICLNAPNAVAGQYTDLGKNLFCTGCRGDLNGDGLVSGADIGIIVAFWGFSGVGVAVIADLNNDGIVDAADLAVLLANWGPCTSR